MGRALIPFLQAVQFLTRLPMPRDLPFDDQTLTRSMPFYPLAGAVIGGVAALVLWVGSLVFPPLVAVLLSLTATLLVTGALHEDGLADVADGLIGGATRDRALEIMRDSTIGVYGALALGMMLSLKAAALLSLPLPAACFLLIAGHGLSRTALLFVVARFRYARAEGAKFTAPSLAPSGFRQALIFAVPLMLLLVLSLGVWATLVSLLTSVGFTALFSRAYLRKLDGYTGDCLGATQQVAELGLYLGALACLA